MMEVERRASELNRFGGKSAVEVGGVFAVVAFLITLAFNAGIQYGQISNLKATEEAHTIQIQGMQSSSANNGVILSHIQTMVEDMKAAQELRATGASR